MKFKENVILVVDDRPDIIFTIKTILKTVNIPVISAANGKEGVETATAKLPDLIIMDIKMPEMNGFEACEEIKSNEKTKDIPVIFLTSEFKEVKHKVKGFEAGGIDYLLKPFKNEELIARVNSMLRLRNTHLELRQKNRHYMEMLSFISHELKNPLTSIVGVVETLKNNILGELPPEHLKLVDIMDRNAVYIQSMIERYLNLSKIENGELTPEIRECNFVNEILNPVLSHIEVNIEKNQKQFEKEINIDDKFTIKNDPDLLKVAINNLLGNAIKYSDDNGKIKLKINVEDNHLILSVWNTGEGIPEDKIETIFNKFERLRTRATRKQKGTGLGLFNTMQIIKILKGDLWCESVVDDWSQFTFKIPL